MFRWSGDLDLGSGGNCYLHVVVRMYWLYAFFLWFMRFSSFHVQKGEQGTQSFLLSFFFKNLFIFLCAMVCVHVCLCEGVGFPGTRVIDSCAAL